jgi:LPXTG-motif cell wall-anchored protein
LQATTHFADKWAGLSAGDFFPVSLLLFPVFGFGAFFGDSGTRRHIWAAPVSYAILGLVFVAIGLFIARRRREMIPAAELL